MESSLEKKQRVNLLMDCYIDLLTDKQREYLSLYYEEDLSLSEIAEDLDVSRNAVYDNLKRAVTSLEDYEKKLHLLEKHIQRMDLIQRIETEQATSNDQLNDYLEMLKNI
ncbi:YlxM family DNA-binding protein [Candidatus Stoquefichus sp. SB1]|uniref:YlxM family DNA-binding protein n=1 Tax=Candidatus Stoquefichus sp. SB1 TaxID=1658109 RepID=UPI00067E7419|nr:YlxM family DNA-binding protein [Candidatus Stoquefichus sp. SB1]